MQVAATPITVMIVDDSAEFRLVLHDLVETETGFRVVAEANDGIEALELYPQTAPDVVVMDIRMAGMTGVEATRRLLKLDPQASVVLVSSGESADMPAAAYACGAAAVLCKLELDSASVFPLLRELGRPPGHSTLG